MKLLAVDGNSILNRAFYGIRPLTTKDGVPTNAIYGFLTILLRMQQEVRPDALAFTFDMRAPTFRHQRYDGYKAQRKGMPEELAQQLPLLKDLLRHLGYAIVEQEGFEADDLLGTLSKACCEAGESCVIATGDRDSFQLINPCTTVRLASTQGGRPQADIYNEAAIKEKYGLTPGQLIDMKALMGDASDNIPGVAGIGEKGAMALIAEFGSLNAIYEDLDTLPIKDSLREKLRAGKDMALLSRELVTICCDAPIDTSLQSYIPAKKDNARAWALMSKLELFSLLDKFGIAPEEFPPEQAEAGEPAKELAVVFNTLPEALLTAAQLDVLFSMKGLDITGLCVIGADTLYLFDTNAPATARKILEAPVAKRTCGVKALHRHALCEGYEVQNITFDAELAGYILNPNASVYSVERLAAEYAVAPLRLGDMFGTLSPLLEDSARFTALANLLLEKLRENAQIKLFRDIELPLAAVLAHMEHTGFAVDAPGLMEYGEGLEKEIRRAMLRIYELAGEEFNLNSPKQLGAILFDKLGLPAKKKTKTGYSTDVEVLEALAPRHAIAGEILEYRKVQKLKSTYVDGLLKVVGMDGRIHTSFQQTLTRTGRISSTEPNMQNIPIRTPLGSELRRFFHAGEGNILVDADYSQIELRVLAHIADDKAMIAAFESGEDIHRNTASQVFDLPPMMVTPLMRSRAKAVNFGIVYGIGAYSLSQDIGVTVSEADSYIKSYLATYSGVRQYMDDMVEYAKTHGYIKTLLERRRPLPELSSSNRATREFGKRVAMNTPIQGTAADIIKIAMVRVHERLRREKLKARLILQVHDELIVECPQSELQAVQALLREEMENAVPLSVPLTCDLHAGKTWLEAK